MSKQFFTDKQMADLLLNPNVFSVTRSTLMLTKSFKEKFYAEYLKGTLPRNILERHGFSADIIGQRRIWSITQHIKDEYAKYGEFHEGRRPPGPLQRPGGRQRARSSEPSRDQGGIPAATGGVFKKNYICKDFEKIGAVLMNDSSSIFEIIYETTRTSENRLNIRDLCNMAGVSRSGYYAWLNAAPLRTAREERDRRDFDLILRAYNMDGYPKGAREIHMTLLHMTPPVIMNRKKVLRLMNKYNLICPVRKLNPRRQLIRDMQTGNVAANLLKRRFEEFGPRTVLLTDITYLPYNGIFAYLSTILDAFTKQVLAYAVSASLEIDFVLDTVKALLRDHPVALNTITIIHSDQGSHYTSHDFIDLLRKSDLRRSMSRRGNCWDNAPQESFFGHMKDCIRDKLAAAASFEEVKTIIDDYIDYYNNRRYQWDLAKLSPNEFYNFVTTGKYPLDVPYVPAPPEITRDPCELAVDAVIGSLFGQIP